MNLASPNAMSLLRKRYDRIAMLLQTAPKVHHNCAKRIITDNLPKAIMVEFCFVFLCILCILCVLSPFGAVLVSKLDINCLKIRRRKIVISIQSPNKDTVENIAERYAFLFAVIVQAYRIFKLNFFSARYINSFW